MNASLLKGMHGYIRFIRINDIDSILCLLKNQQFQKQNLYVNPIPSIQTVSPELLYLIPDRFPKGPGYLLFLRFSGDIPNFFLKARVKFWTYSYPHSIAISLIIISLSVIIFLAFIIRSSDI